MSMSYDCPSCHKSFPHQGQYQSTHHEEQCPHCGQDLQWDEPQQSAGHGLDTSSGPPKPCEHRDRQRPGAKVPKFSK